MSQLFNPHYLPTLLVMMKHTRTAELVAASAIAPGDYELVTGRGYWTAADRQLVSATMNRLIHAATNLAGMDPSVLPASYVASWIGVMVDPVNWQTACGWFATTPVDSSLLVDTGDSGLGVLEPVNRHRLFALVWQIAGAVDRGDIDAMHDNVRSDLNLVLRGDGTTAPAANPAKKKVG